MLLEENEERKNKYHPILVEPNSFVPQSFAEWWLDYYGSHRQAMDDCISTIIDVCPSYVQTDNL